MVARYRRCSAEAEGRVDHPRRPEHVLIRIAEIISAQRIGALVVMDDDNALIGIASERDVVKAIANRREQALAMTAAGLMTPKPVVATPETSVDEAMEIMDQGYFRHLPVMRDGKPAATISIRHDLDPEPSRSGVISIWRHLDAAPSRCATS